MTFVPASVKVNYTQAKAYCPIRLLSVRQKTVQIWWQEYPGWNTGACSHTYNNLFKPWKYTETAMHHVITHIQEAVKYGKLILNFPRLLMELLIVLHVDITKAAKWHGLGDTH